MDASSRRVLLLSQGTRGDCQPFIAFANGLKDAGFDPLVLTNPEEESLCHDLGVRFASNHVPFRSFMSGDAAVKAFTKNDTIGAMSILAPFNEKHVVGLYEAVWSALTEFRPELVVCGSQHWLDIVWIPILFRVPALAFNLSNSHTVDHYKAPLGLPSLPFGMNKCLWHLVCTMWLRGLRPAAELLGEKSGRPPADFWPTLADLYGVFGHLDSFSFIPYSICQDEDIHGRKSTDRPWFVYTGGLVLRPEICTGREFGGDDEAALERFLALGPEPPVYVGWGSVTCSSNVFMASFAVRALKMAGVRGIVLGGWSGVSSACLQGLPDEAELQQFCRDNVLFVKTASHERLFPRCAAVVHHGGAGTTAAGIRSGVPNIVTPVCYDQFDNAKLVSQSGQGIAMGHLGSLKPGDLAAAIKKCVTDATLNRTARELGQKVRMNDGTLNATNICVQFLRNDVGNGSYWRHFDKFSSAKRNRSAKWKWLRPWCCSS